MNKVKLVRKPKVPGEFTQVNYDLLWNPDLSSNQKIMLITIFSNKDKHSFTKGTIQEKTNIPSSTFDREWHKLIELGYIHNEHKGNKNWNTTFYEEAISPN